VIQLQPTRFFYEPSEFLKIDLETGKMTNTNELSPGVYQGGNANIFSEYLKVSGEEILYIGDHIYGDILRLKKDCNWRTGLVVEELTTRSVRLKKQDPVNKKINDLMAKKDLLKKKWFEISDNPNKNVETKKRHETIQEQVTKIDAEISACIVANQKLFNQYWVKWWGSATKKAILKAKLNDTPAFTWQIYLIC